MKDVYEFLRYAGVFYLATVDGDKPRVRPFGISMIYEDKLYVLTGKKKDVSKQIQKNPHVEICAVLTGEQWLRVECELVRDDRKKAKKAILDANPTLRSMYDENDDNTEVLYMKNATATFSSFSAPPRTVKF